DPERVALPGLAADALRPRFVSPKGLAHDRNFAGDRALLPGDSGGWPFRDSLRVDDAGTIDCLCGGRGLLAGCVCSARTLPVTQFGGAFVIEIYLDDCNDFCRSLSPRAQRYLKRFAVNSK